MSVESTSRIPVLYLSRTEEDHPVDISNTWAALGEIQRALHQISTEPDRLDRDGVTSSEAEALEEMADKIGQILAVEAD